MQTLSSASRTCMASASAVECTATVEMPISLQARWTRSAISPRLAMRILSNIALLDDGQGLAEFHGLTVLGHDRPHDAALGRGDRVHGLHRLDDQKGLALGDRVADLDEGWRAGLGLHVDGADHGRLDHLA